MKMIDGVVSIVHSDGVNIEIEHKELVMCKHCKWKQGSECVRFAEVRPWDNDFCSRGERKEE